ncbi:Non-specific serine/threonine protein kinase [Bertholletia excelsa]
MGGGEEEIETEGVFDVENTIFVAVGKNVKEDRSTLLWALQSFSGKRICLLHVHQSASLGALALMEGKFSFDKWKQKGANASRELEQKKMHKLLNEYLHILGQEALQAGKVWIEMDNVERGIVQIIVQLDVRWLVMGAAAAKHYSKKLSELKSKKATFVCQQAPESCQVWFACNGCLIYTRERYNSHVGGVMEFSSSPSSSGIKLLKNHADTDGDSNEPEVVPRGFMSHVLVHSKGIELPKDQADTDGDANELNVMPRGLTSQVLVHSTGKMVHKLQSDPLSSDETGGNGCHPDQSLSINLQGGSSTRQGASNIHVKLEHAKIDAENSKQKAFEESLRRWKAEADALEAMRKAEAIESSCRKGIKQRKEVENILATQRQELERMKDLYDQYSEELQMIHDQKPVLESQLMESQSMEEELEEKIIQAANLLITFKGKRDKLRVEYNNAIGEINRLQHLVEYDAADLHRLHFFSLSFRDIHKATQEFDLSQKIGDGRYGSVYKGLLQHLKVAIKMLPFHGSQSHVEFEKEAWNLSRVRHPNLVTLIGTCTESRSLIYEYVENGSLEDRLACRAKTPSLTWQTRTRIASEICSALVFLHSSQPSIIHGNLKPSKILLDSNFVSKIGDVGLYRLVSQDFCNKSNPEVSTYLDPEFLETGELTPKSDVYSFGIVLLRLLTGRPAVGVVKDVKCALEGDYFSTVLDPAAGEWPLEEAKILARVALRCCDTKQVNRPDLVSEVWCMIELMGKCVPHHVQTQSPRDLEKFHLILSVLFFRR